MGDYTAVFDFQDVLRDRYRQSGKRVLSVPNAELTDLLCNLDGIYSSELPGAVSKVEFEGSTFAAYDEEGFGVKVCPDRSFVIMRSDPRESFLTVFPKGRAVQPPVIFYPSGSLLSTHEHRELIIDYLFNCEAFPEEGAILYGKNDWIEAIGSRFEKSVLRRFRELYHNARCSTIRINSHAPVELFMGKYYKDTSFPELSFTVSRLPTGKAEEIEDCLHYLFAKNMPFNYVLGSSVFPKTRRMNFSFLIDLE